MSGPCAAGLKNFKRVGTVLILGILLIPIQITRNSVNQEGIKD